MKGERSVDLQLVAAPHRCCWYAAHAGALTHPNLQHCSLQLPFNSSRSARVYHAHTASTYRPKSTRSRTPHIAASCNYPVEAEHRSVTPSSPSGGNGRTWNELCRRPHRPRSLASPRSRSGPRQPCLLCPPVLAVAHVCGGFSGGAQGTGSYHAGYPLVGFICFSSPVRHSLHTARTHERV